MLTCSKCDSHLFIKEVVDSTINAIGFLDEDDYERTETTEYVCFECGLPTTVNVPFKTQFYVEDYNVSGQKIIKKGE